MRDINRIDDFCDRLKEVWKTVPDWRFGQLICNTFGEVQNRTKQDVFYIEDDKMIESLEKLFKNSIGGPHEDM